MTVPQSLLVVALALAWLVVLVPSSSRRRKPIQETVEGNGFRVLSSTRRSVRRMKPGKSRSAVRAADHSSEDEMSSESTDLGDNAETVTAQAALWNEDAGDLAGANDETTQFEAVSEDAVVAEPETESLATVAQLHAQPQELDDEAQLRADYEALREQARKNSAPLTAAAAHDEEVAAPNRSRRGRFDPEAAERARAYKYARRRRVVMVLLALVVGFALGAMVISPVLWAADVVAVLLLVLFLAYLRRQVMIEADIRERRLARLQRARQIRPEAGVYEGSPYASAVSDSAPQHRRGRVAVDLDDDDPAFDDLEHYAPVVYQRASGQ